MIAGQTPLAGLPRRPRPGSTALPLLALVLLLLCQLPTATSTCLHPVNPCDPSQDYFSDKATFTYPHSTFSDISYANTYVDLTITANGSAYPYRIIRCGCEAVVHSSAPPPLAPNTQLISAPPAAVYVDDTVIFSMLFTNPQVAPQIKAVNDVTYAFNPKLKALVASRSATSITSYANLTSSSSSSSSSSSAVPIDLAILYYGNVKDYTAAAVGKPYFVSAQALEPHPVASAEWMKLFAILFFDVPQVTDIFQNVDALYNNTRDRANTMVANIPSVMVNAPDSPTLPTSWAESGGAQYTAQYFRDANVDYRLSRDGVNTSEELSLANITKNFASAQFWVNFYLFPGIPNATMQALLDNKAPPLTQPFDPQIITTFKSLASVRCGTTWAEMKRITLDGNGNDLFELGVVRPDLVLADLVMIFHPEAQLNNQNFTFYYNLGNPGPNQTDPCPYNRLPATPPSGRSYVPSAYNITGVDRFGVEDSIPGYVGPACANASNVAGNDVQLLFSRGNSNPSSTTPSTVLNLTASVPSNMASKYDSAKVASAIQKSLLAAGFSGVTVRALNSASKSHLSGGAIAGIVIGSIASALLLLALLALLLLALRKHRRQPPPAERDHFPSDAPISKTKDPSHVDDAEAIA